MLLFKVVGKQIKVVLVSLGHRPILVEAHSSGSGKPYSEVTLGRPVGTTVVLIVVVVILVVVIIIIVAVVFPRFVVFVTSVSSVSDASVVWVTSFEVVV